MQEKKQSLIPELRFPGFEGEWEVTVLSEILRERNEQYPENEDYPLMAFVANVGVCPKGDRYDRGALVKDAQSKKYKRTKLGDFIYSSNNLETGSIGQNHFGNASISPVYSIFEVKNKYNNIFIGALLTKKEFISKMVQYRQGVIYGQWKIHETEFLKLTVPVPSLPEQQKIAECLSSVDNLIQEETDQLQALKDHKKGLMQQLFPQEGETVPKLRFPGFEGEWEEKKLGEIAEVNPKSDSLPEQFIYIDLESVESGVLLKLNQIDKINAPSRAQRLLKDGDILFQMVRPYQQNNYHFFKKDNKEYVASTGYAQIRYSDCSEYLYQFLHTDTFVEKVINKCVGGNYPAINSTDLSNMTVFFPSLSEQQKIADCLSSLDEEIAAQQQKVDTLKEHKKGLMQKLFPVIN